MGLLAAIHDLWESEAALEALLPAERVFTGRVPQFKAMPYASIESSTSSPHVRTNDSMARDVGLTIHVWTETYAEGDAIRQEIEAAFANRTIETDDGNVLDVTIESSGSLQEDDPSETTWQTVIQLGLLVSRARVH